MKKILLIGDAACPSGFARSLHAIADVLREEYDLTVMGINYRGDPHPYPYPIYAAAVNGDAFGVRRLLWMCDLVKPNLIILQNDPWNFPAYTHTLQQLEKHKDYKDVPVVAFAAVDGKNLQRFWFDGLSHAIFWTKFAMEEAREAGYKGPAAVVPLGVDTDLYRPMDKLEARRRRRIDAIGNAFIVGNVNRNQVRKRWDLTLRYFAQWVHSKKVEDAYLYLHTAPTGDDGVDVKQLAAYYGILDRLLLREPMVFYGDSEQDMVDTYNCFDLQITTTQGEGFGLTTFEGMACGVPQIVPNWSALGELCKGAAWLVPCTSTSANQMNIIGGIADEDLFVKALHAMYANPGFRDNNRKAGLERVSEPRFRWRTVGENFLREVNMVLGVGDSGVLPFRKPEEVTA